MISDTAFTMKLSILLLLFYALFLVNKLVAGRRPNPCSFPDKLTCKATQVCAAIKIRWGWRRAICVAPPKPHGSCACDRETNEVVCCRIVTNRYSQRVVLTIESDACMCERCLLGQVLFAGNCTKPPLHEVGCTRHQPTCCYIRALDLTFSASSRCRCSKARTGRVISRRLCK